MRSFSRAASFLVLLAFSAVAALPAAAAAKTEKAQFKLVIEGTTIAQRTFHLGGKVSLCEESVNGSFVQNTEYLRGKGVVLDFIRKKVKGEYEYGLKRGGGKPEFTVVDTATREGFGSAKLEPDPGLVEPLLAAAKTSCNVNEPDLGKVGECKVKKTTRSDLGLKIKGNTFAVVPVGDELAKPTLPKGTCGETKVTEGFLALDYEWPDVLETDFQPFPDAKMFNRRINAVAVSLNETRHLPPKEIGTPPLTGTAEDYGANQATVRFIRCGEHHRPAC